MERNLKLHDLHFGSSTQSLALVITDSRCLINILVLSWAAVYPLNKNEKKEKNFLLKQLSVMMIFAWTKLYIMNFLYY